MRLSTSFFVALTLAVLLVNCGAVGELRDGSAPLVAQQPQSQPQQQDEFVPISQLPAQDQLPAAPLLVTAYAFVWLALFAYVVSVARRLAGVQREVERLESDIKRGTRG
jgi:CcmD family protein